MDEINKLQVALAELRTDIKHLSHDVKTMTQKLEAMPTHRDYMDLKDRVHSLEKNQSKAAWAIISAWIGGLGVVGVLASVVNKIAGIH